MSFYNTTNEHGTQLVAFKEKARSQDDVIWGVFKSGAKMTPFEVSAILKDRGVRYPITSIRRSIHTLTRVGLIEKTDQRGMGEYGRQNYKWKAT